MKQTFTRLVLTFLLMLVSGAACWKQGYMEGREDVLSERPWCRGTPVTTIHETDRVLCVYDVPTTPRSKRRYQYAS